MTDYENRQNWDLNAWPEMYGKLKELQALVFLSPPGRELNLMVFTMAGLSAGCRHRQAHGAYGLDRLGLRLGRIGGLGHRQSRPDRLGHRETHRCRPRTTTRPSRPLGARTP